MPSADLHAQSALLGPASNAEFQTQLEPELLAKARSPETSPYEFMLLCKRLQVYGTPLAAAAAASQLADPAKSHSARMTLEIIPCPEAAAELRSAASKVQDPILLAGIFNSLGMRRDAQSIPLLLPYLKHENAPLASAAAFALARIGEAEYADAMTDYVQRMKNAAYPQLKDALDLNLMYGENLRKNGKTADAERIFLNVEASAPRDFYRYAASIQLLLNRDPKTASRMTEWLTGTDELKAAAALRAAYFLKGKETAAVLHSAFPKVDAQRQAAILDAVGVQQDPGSQEILIQAIGSEVPEVAAAAMRAIQGFTDAVVLEDLFQTAAKAESEELRAGAIHVLSLLPPSANLEILKKLENCDQNEAETAAELCGIRKISTARPMLRPMAQNGSTKALLALGAVAELEDLQIFFAGLQAQDAEYADAAEKSLAAACALIPDKMGVLEALVQEIGSRKGQPDHRLTVCRMLNILTGPEVLAYLRQAALDAGDLELQDCATNVLGRTLDPEAAPILLEAAQTPNHPYGKRALRGYLRIIRQFSMAKWARMSMLEKALACPLCGESEREIVRIIQKQYQLDPQNTLTEEQKTLSTLEIVSAVYGIDEPGKNLDVTLKMRDFLRKTESLVFSLPDRWNDHFTDPAPGTHKFMKLVLRYADGTEKTLSIREGNTIRIPAK